MPLCKTIVRVAVLGVVAGTAVVLVAQTPRGSALYSQVKQGVADKIDRHIDDPVALRNQLRKLEAQYPERIAAVRADLSEVQRHLTELERERAVGERVLELTRTDLEVLEDLITRAEEARSQNGMRAVRVSFDNQSLDIAGAYARANSVASTHQAYASRQNDIERDLDLLSQQEARLGELLAQLETEQNQFQAQLWQLDQQVDAIARNERMIGMLETRDRAIARHDRYQSHSLHEVQGKIAERLASQERRLAGLATVTERQSYEQRAQFELDVLRRAGAAARKDRPGDVNLLNNPGFVIERERPIEIKPKGESERETEHSTTRIGRGR